MNQGLKYLLVGCGKIGWRHAIQMQRTGTLLAACDIDENTAERFRDEFKVKVFTDIEDLFLAFPQADIVAICTPNGLHAEQSIAALNKGYHVLCEKPMALEVSDCTNMISASEKNEKKLLVVKQNRYNPPVIAVKKLIEEDKLGKIFSIQVNCFWNRDAEYYKSPWRGSKKLDGGTLYTQFSHFIDILYFLAGDIDQVSAYKANLNHKGLIDFEDCGVINFQFSSGAIGAMHYTVNSFSRNMEGSVTIHAAKGSIKIGGEYLNQLDYQCIQGIKLDLEASSTLPNDYGNYTGSMSNHDKVYDSLHDVIFNDHPAHATADDGLKTVEIINKINKSALIF